ncbi:hypothetical protein D4R42_01465 [bacterium]|nr:MAG: hypothetical protein D4R42_01465 [bacterium]
MADKIYAEGMYGSFAKDGDPTWKMGRISIQIDRFKAFLEEHRKEGDDWINLEILQRKSDNTKMNFQLDTFTPDPSKRREEPPQTMENVNRGDEQMGPDDENLPY